MNAFEKWFEERPLWLQTAAARIIASRKSPSPKEILELSDLAIAEASGVGAKFEKVPLGIFSGSGAASTLRLIKAENVVGVNAIQHGVGLKFEGDITVVFGQNGSGKSGFARLMKHVCGARNKQELLPNVFSESPSDPTAQITFTENGVPITHDWRLDGGPVSQLRHVHVFDSEAAKSYVNARNEATYEPRLMRFISRLIEIADLVMAELNRRKTAIPSRLPTFPANFKGTAAESFFSKIQHNTQDSVIDATCAFTEKHIARKNIIEMSLKENDVSGKIQKIGLRKKSLGLFEKEASVLKGALSNENSSILIKARSDAMAKRKAASDDAEKIFGKIALDGVGKESWKLLWESARKYSEQFAYPGINFPVVQNNSLCVLCLQDLNAEAKMRLSDFEKFVKSNLEATATAAENELKKRLLELPSLPSKEKWLLDAQAIGLEIVEAESFFLALSNRLLALKSATDIKSIPPLDWHLMEEKIAASSLSLKQLEIALTEVQKSGKKEELEKELKELKSIEWLSNNKNAVRVEIKRLNAILEIEKAERLTNTRPLTQKKISIAKDELADGYRERFFSELKLLGGERLPIEPVPVPEGKGKISFSFTLKGAKRNAETGAVLSDGENRIVALAAFLADISGSGQPTPFIFDDPISSLDQEYEECVVERLLVLAQTRQVVVFTHRLSFLALIEDAVETKNKAAPGTLLPVEIVHLRRIGSVIGVVDELDVRHKNPHSGFCVLRDQKLAQIRKYEAAGNAAAFDLAMKAACGDFRILIERTVEKILLDGSVERFRRTIQTQQIKKLAKINTNDCSMIDEMMTKYSKFEHSQPHELPATFQTPNKFKQDLDKIISWIEEFKKRAA